MLVRNRTAFVIMFAIILAVMTTVIVMLVRSIIVPVTRNAVSGAIIRCAVDITMEHANRQPREKAEHS